MALTAWLRINRLGLRRSQLTTAPATKAYRSDALAPDSTTGLMPPSPPSPGRSVTPSGGAVHASKCVGSWHCFWMAEIEGLLPRSASPTCKCGALRLFGATLAPAAEPAPSSASTSAKQDSPPSAPALTFVPSGSPYSREVIRSGYPVQG